MAQFDPGIGIFVHRRVVLAEARIVLQPRPIGPRVVHVDKGRASLLEDIVIKGWLVPPQGARDGLVAQHAEIVNPHAGIVKRPAQVRQQH